MPGLLSLQGRLELLKSQLQLRELLANGEIQNEKEPIDEDAAVKKADESITYVNGENDEEEADDIIGSVGNSESDSSDEEKDADDAVIDEDEDESAIEEDDDEE